MSNKQTEPLAPKLRFPDFRGSSSWQIRNLGQACHMQAGKFVPAAEIHDKYMQGLFPCYGGNGLRGYTATFTHNGKYSLIGRQGALCGNIKQGIGQFHATEHAIVVTQKKGTTGDWLFFVLDLMNLNRFATGQAQPGLSVDVLEKLPIAVPNEEAEQQKIADCLSSLDELIAAQARKVDALKTHKIGLMQHLFPREGETQPRLRFPEFLNSGEWEWVELGEKVDLLSGYPFDGSDISQDSSGIPLLRGINVTEGRIRHNSEIDRYYIGSIEGLEKYRLQVNDLVIGMDGSKVGKNSALVSENDVGALLIQRVARLRAKKVPLIEFIFQRVHSPSFHAYVDRINTSSGIPHISAKQIKEFRICFPSDEEQQRIVDCLSSLDTLINTATQELETFKTHKKGLMQQLFPSAEALEA
ncbi:restriction endonuclease subunit S [Paracidovorax sp. MALMAid1276]|uniref:restriction endonuclease subunit S n=1 Tax=Paracidovorax sp. MALMAid1276 TaxID=3411631 RepID=UPI003B9B47F9